MGEGDRPVRIGRALISVSDKTGLVELGRFLADREVEILSTGGSARALAAAGVPVREVSAYTDFPEMMDGRVKTLHPKVHGGLLALRDAPAHRDAMQAHGIAAIDLSIQAFPSGGPCGARPWLPAAQPVRRASAHFTVLSEPWQPPVMTICSARRWASGVPR